MKHEQNHVMSLEFTLLIAILTGVAIAVIITIAAYKCILARIHRPSWNIQRELVYDEDSHQGTIQHTEHMDVNDVSTPRNEHQTELPNQEDEALLLDNKTLQGATGSNYSPHENRPLAQSGYQFEKSTSDQHISQALTRFRPRTLSSSVYFNKRDEAVIPHDVFTSSSSSGVMNTELPNLHVYKKTTFSDSSANSSLKLSSMSQISTSSWEI